ncbi:MAG: GHKL domain-containing protein, partial [Lachnospiraceae bacterium]|nr:GHKL domain-containing protein [Lachnospiraceae bacterium]
YLEAMKDGTIPQDQYDRYLGIVINETDRLSKLTNGLLTLNNLNSSGMMLDRTDFDINSIIRETAASFEGTCRSRKLTIDLVMTDERMLVHADMERIRQVLYNLIDNAIKFSHDSDTITVETTEKGTKVFVSVKDTGIGIPKDDLKMVFERFYKSDLSRGKDKRGTGLGLSIVKEIIKAHDENINVISTVDVGTEFIFSLPMAEVMQQE